MRPSVLTASFAALAASALAACVGTVSAPPDAPDGSSPARDAAAPDTAVNPGRDVGVLPDAPVDAAPPGDAPLAPDTAPDAPPSTSPGLSGRYPGDRGIETDPHVIFHSDFERGLAGWTEYTRDTSMLDVRTDGTTAHAGTRFLRASVTRTQLAADPYISAHATFDFPARVPHLYWRFYARFVANSATPHHWVRVGAGNATYNSDGLANTRPAGDQGFWFDLDANDSGWFEFYAYWYLMRSGRCNDGSATPGCAGDQGTTYYYGNNFSPAGQTAFPRDAWFCIEVEALANTVGTSDGALALWINDRLVGEYRPGTPRGRWLRDNFFTYGPYYMDVQAFEGFEFRSSTDVAFKRVVLDAYYERGSLQARIDAGLVVPEAQVILYDDVVVATERVGCMAP